MDREQALQLLRGGTQGIQEWNRMRTEGEAELPNLIGVNLVGADLSGVNLVGANLSRANLSGADLVEANLSVANLIGADLSRAKLSGADLDEAIISGAKLSGADLSEAKFGHTVITDVDLSEVRGLEAVIHRGPSSVGTDTLFRSKGKIPAEFLRGCGVPDELITYLPSLLGSLQPIQFYSCFISHSSKDLDFARRLHSRLRDEKLRVWFAPEDMKGGRTGLEQVEQAILLYDKLLLVLSKASMASGWVQHEIHQALGREKKDKRRVLFPIRVCSLKLIKEWKYFDSDRGQDLARIIRDYHIPDFSKWKTHDAFEAAVTRLLDDLKTEEINPPEKPHEQ